MANVKMEKGEGIEMKHLCEYSLFLTLPAGKFYLDKVHSLKNKWFHANLGKWEVPIINIMEVLKLFSEIEIVGEIPELEILKQKRDLSKRDYYDNLQCIEDYPIDMPYVIERETYNEFYRIKGDYVYVWKNGDWYMLTQNVEEVKKELITKAKPFGHQIEGFHYMMNRNVMLLADDMGLGKTLQFASACEWRHMKKGKDFRKVLYVTKAGLRDNVLEDLRLWLPDRQIIVIDGSQKERMDKLRFFFRTKEMAYCIISYEGVKKHIEQLKMIPIDGVAVDECHKAKNAAGATFEAISQLTWIPFRIPMSGTPVINRPEELWPILHFLGIEDRTYHKFMRDHYKWGGYKNRVQLGPNEEELERTHNKLRQYMLRRMKDEVMDMPEKTHRDIFVPMTTEQASLYKAVRDQIVSELDDLKKGKTFGNPLVKILRLKQILTNPAIIGSDAPSAKHERLLDIVEELAEAGHKAIIFTQFEEVEIEELTKMLSKYNPAVVTGKTKDSKAEERRFKYDDSCKVFIGTSSKCREGFNLQVAQYVIFLDLEWAPAYIRQCEDRARRIGTKSNLTILRLLIRNTVDDYIVNVILKRKQEIFDAIVEGKGSFTSADIDELVANL